MDSNAHVTYPSVFGTLYLKDEDLKKILSVIATSFSFLCDKRPPQYFVEKNEK